MRASDPARALDELLEDGALAELVLGASDDEQVALVVRWTLGTHCHDRKPKGCIECAGEPAFSRFVRRRSGACSWSCATARPRPSRAEDHRRRLTDRGQRDATAAGEWLADAGHRAHARVRLLRDAHPGRPGRPWWRARHAGRGPVSRTPSTPRTRTARSTSCATRRQTRRSCCTSATTRRPPRWPTCSTTATPTRSPSAR